MRITTSFALFLFGMLQAPSEAAEATMPPAKYAIKQSDATTGSIIPRNTVTSAVIPINKKYSELTAEQKQFLRSQYEDMDEADEPPFPEDGWTPIYKLILKAHQRVLVKGTLRMYIEIDSKGLANTIRILETPDPELTKMVAGILMLSKYKPALCAGVPCKMEIPFNMEFNVRL